MFRWDKNTKRRRDVQGVLKKLLTESWELCWVIRYLGPCVPKWSYWAKLAQTVKDNLNGPNWSKDLVSQHCPQNFVSNFFGIPCTRQRNTTCWNNLFSDESWAGAAYGWPLWMLCLTHRCISFRNFLNKCWFSKFWFLTLTSWIQQTMPPLGLAWSVLLVGPLWPNWCRQEI